MNNIMKRNNGATGMQRSQGSAAPLTGLVDGVLNRFLDDRFWGFNGLGEQRTVPVNIRETDGSYELEIVAPGLRKEDFKVRMNDTTLTVSFEHKEEEQHDKGYLRQEFRLQAFSRSFTVDSSLIDAERIIARYENGVLWLSLPKKEEARRQHRLIEIQ